MRNIRVTDVRRVVVVTFINERGETVSLPLYAHNGEWRNFGSYQVYGVSKSDPTFSSVHALPHRWRPNRRIIRAIQKGSHG
jgi:hypothetical protein